MAVDASNHNVYVANNLSSTVSVIDESGDARTGTVVIAGTITDSATGWAIAGICAYAIDTTVHQLRAYSAPTITGAYRLTLLPPGFYRVAFESCTKGPTPSPTRRPSRSPPALP